MTVVEFKARVKNKASPAPAEELAAFEAAIVASLPEEYRQFLVNCNGGYVEGCYRYNGPTFYGREAGRAVNGIGGLRHDKGSCSLLWQRDWHEGRIPKSLLWIMGGHGGNAICLGIEGEHRGRIYLWEHCKEPAESEWDGQIETAGNITYLANSFTDFVAGLEKSFDPMEWYNNQPKWVRVVLFPVLLICICIYGIALMVFFVVGVLPFFWIKGILENRRFWRILRQSGQVARWPEVEAQLRRGAGTLVVEMSKLTTPEGRPYCAWWIAAPRAELDPEHIVPSWQNYEQRGSAIFDSPDYPLLSLNRWTVRRLGAYERSARILMPSGAQLAKLSDEAKREQVLVVSWYCWGSLANRWKRRARPKPRRTSK